MTTRIVTYHRRVSAPREIAEITDYLVLKQENSRWRPRWGDTIINWGLTELPPQLRIPGLRIINTPLAVANAVNKRRSFELMHLVGVPTVEVTYDLNVALQWHAAGSTVIQRNQLTGRQGEGIVVCTSRGTVPNGDGRAWTKYFDRKDEYRVHVMGGRVIDVQKKRLTTEKANEIRRKREANESVGNVYRIRSYPNGWIFARNGVVCPQSVLNASIAAVAAIGLDFGAVDIGHKRSNGSARVFEVNSAPGIEGTTVQSYAAGLSDLVRSAVR